MYILIVKNEQGASNQTAHDTKKDVRAEIKSWFDPENLTIKVLDKEHGSVIFEGNALSF